MIWTDGIGLLFREAHWFVDLHWAQPGQVFSHRCAPKGAGNGGSPKWPVGPAQAMCSEMGLGEERHSSTKREEGVHRRLLLGPRHREEPRRQEVSRAPSWPATGQ